MKEACKPHLTVGLNAIQITATKVME